MQGVAAARHMHNVLTVKRVLGRTGGGSHFLHPQAILIVDEVDRFAALTHALQLTPLSPGIGPSAITQRIANGVVGDCRTIVRRQLVLPVGVTVGEAVRFERSTDRTGGVGIGSLAQDVAAQIIGIQPSRAIAACRGVIGIVGTDQLAQQIVGIADRLDAVADAGDVARIVIGVGQRRAGLGNGAHQRGSAASTMAASHIAIGRGDGRSACVHRTLGNTSDAIIGISYLTSAAEVQQRRPVLVVMGEGRGIRRAVRAYHLLHQRYPVGRQSEDVVDNMYTRIEKAMVWISYGEVYVHCISMKESLINRLKVKIGAQANA